MYSSIISSVRSFIGEIDSNARLDALLEKTHVARIVDLAVPFLSLHPKMTAPLQIGLGTVKSVQEIKAIWSDLKSHEWKSSLLHIIELAFTVSSVALSVLFPEIQLFFSQSYYLLKLIYQLGIDLKSHEWKAALKDCAYALVSIAFLASLATNELEFIVLSVTLQCLKEFLEAIQIYKYNKKVPETIAKIALAIIRGYYARDHFFTCYRNYCGKPLTQDLLNEFIDSKEMSLEKFLIRKDLSSHVKGLKFKNLKNRTIDHLKLEKCSFEGSKETIFCRTRFNKCLFDRSSHLSLYFLQCHFLKTRFSDSSFYDCRFFSTQFHACTVSNTDFNNSFLSLSNFFQCDLHEVNFHGAFAASCRITKCNLQDCFLLDTAEDFHIQESVITSTGKPVVALLWDFKQKGQFASYISDILKEQGAIILKCDYNPRTIDENCLRQEVEKNVQTMHENGSQTDLSIAERLVQNPLSSFQIAKACRYIKSLSGIVNAVILPGGNHVEEIFYKNMSNAPEGNYKRSMIEFALVHEAKNRQLPMLAICRGSQLVNVYFGGTLKNVEGHCGRWTPLEIKNNIRLETDSLIQEMLQSRNIMALGMHYQASDKIGKNLEVVMEYEDVPKAIVSTDHNFLLLQFHPEACKIQEIFLNNVQKYIANLQEKISLLKQSCEEADHLEKLQINLNNALEFQKEFPNEMAKKRNIFRFFLKKASSNQPIPKAFKSGIPGKEGMLAV